MWTLGVAKSLIDFEEIEGLGRTPGLEGVKDWKVLRIGRGGGKDWKLKTNECIICILYLKFLSET